MNNNEYFLVQHTLSINLEKVTQAAAQLDQHTFEAEIPGPFKMAGDLSQADSNILAPLKLNNENTQALWTYLQTQNKKINTLLSYVLSQQDDPSYRFSTKRFSAGSLIIENNDTWQVGENVRLKIFLPEEASAIYCYATVTCIEDKDCIFTYTLIREQDRELLIRASLHIQTQQLKERAQQRELDS